MPRTGQILWKREMTIDERLEKVAGRHEALAQSVKVINLQVGHLTTQVDRLTMKVDVVADALRDLVSVARSHEQRISGLKQQS